MDRTSETFLSQLERISNGFRASQILFTALRLRLFSILGQQALSADELAAKLAVKPRGTRILCDALCALKLLQKSGGRYSNTEMTRQYLCEESPDHRLGMLEHRAFLYDSWRGLVDRIAGDIPDTIDPRLARTPEKFAKAMVDAARSASVPTAEQLDLSRAKSLLDVGGGPGMYAIAFVRRWPALHVSILDNAETLRVAAENIAKAGLTDRITLVPGDIFITPLQDRYDAVFSSNVIHSYSPDQNRDFVKRAATLLNPGGIVAIKDLALNATRTGPLEAALFSVNMLANTLEGDCYTKSEIARWMRQAGLTVEQDLPVAKVSRIVVGRRAA